MRKLLIFLLMFANGALAGESPIRLALNDLPGKGMLMVLVGVEDARQRGVPIQLSYLNSENIVIQALNSGLADVGMGTPYQYLQGHDSDLRMIYQLSKLAFFPVVNQRVYRGWKDLDGAVMYSHGSGSGTEAVLNILAARHGIQYAEMRYLPGSGTRARAMLEGRIKATVLDAERTRMLLDKDPSRFARLPLGDTTATDEALFASKALIDARADEIKVLLESLLMVWRKTIDDPLWLAGERERLGLLPDLEQDEAATIVPYISDLVAGGAFARDGGVADAAREDFAFYTAAGTLKGDPAELKAEDFWNFGVLMEALQRPDH